MSKVVMKSILTSAMGLSLVLFTGPHNADAQASVFIGNAFGQCAHHSDVVVKIAACKEAAKMTPYPWILRWVYLELARAQRDHGERKDAIVSYARSLAARNDQAVREEMEALGPLTQ